MRKKTNAGKRLAEWGFAALLLLLIVFVILQALGGGKVSMETTPALPAQESEIASFDGYIVRDETPLTLSNASASGKVIDYLLEDGAKTASGTELLAVLSAPANSDAATFQKELDALHEQIVRLEKNQSTASMSYADLSKLAEEIYGSCYELLGRISSGELGGCADIAADMITLMAGYDAVSGNGTDAATLLKLAQSRYEALVASCREWERVSAPESGLFYREADGYETLLTPSLILSAGAGELRSVLSSGASGGNAVGKIADAVTWYLMIFAEESLSANFTAGNVYSVEFYGQGVTLSGKLERVSDPSNGECALVFSFARMPAGFSFSRLQKVRLTLSVTEGYRVPAEALTEEEGQIGVYILDAEMKIGFARVEILYREKSYVLVALNDGSEEKENYLRLYDRIVVSYKGKPTVGSTVG